MRMFIGWQVVFIDWEFRRQKSSSSFCPNSIEYIFAVFAIIANGAAVAFVNPAYTAYELEHALKVTKPSWILTVSGLLGTVVEAKKNAGSNIKGIIVVPGNYETSGGPVTVAPSISLTSATGSSLVPFDVLMSDDGSWCPKDVDIDSSKDVAFILFSSGTTGLPKGVMLSHYNVVAQVTIIESAINISPVQRLPGEQAVSLLYLLVYHAGALIGSVMLGLASNQKLIILDRFRPEQVLSCVEKYKVTSMPVVPAVLVFLAKSSLLSKYDLSSVQRFLVGAAPIGKETLTDFRQLTGSKDIVQGYGLTETTMTCINSFHVPKIKLGSVGVVLPNTEVQVAPAELESLILSHPEVDDVGVIGVPDAEAGELPKAFVVRKHGSKVSAEQIKQFVAGKLTSFKHLRGGVEFVETIPKTESGKIMRRVLRQFEEKLRSKL